LAASSNLARGTISPQVDGALGLFLAYAFDGAVTATIENWKIGIFACLIVTGVRLLDAPTTYHVTSIGAGLMLAPAAIYVASKVTDDRTPVRSSSIVRFLWVYLASSGIFLGLVVTLFSVGAVGIILATSSFGAGGGFAPTFAIAGSLIAVAAIVTTAFMSRLLLAQVAGFVEGLGVRAAFRRALELTRGLYWKNLTIVLVTTVATASPSVIVFGSAILCFHVFGVPWSQAIDPSHIRLAGTIAIPARWYALVALFVALLRYYDRLRARYAEGSSGA
jgi:hypothetical protein